MGKNNKQNKCFKISFNDSSKIKNEDYENLNVKDLTTVALVKMNSRVMKDKMLKMSPIQQSIVIRLCLLSQKTIQQLQFSKDYIEL